MIEKYKLGEKFELSHIYVGFWHYFESSNFFLKNILETRHLKHDERLIHMFMKEPTSDGGHWTMLVNLIEKYGLIPKDNMRETYHSDNTHEMDKYLNNVLRNYAHQIRSFPPKMKISEIESVIDEMMSNIYKILVIFLGEPPEVFDWEYYKMVNDDKNIYKKIKNLKPVKFYQQYCIIKMKDYVTLINYPCSSKPYNRLYNCQYSNNMVNGNNNDYYNVSVEVLKETARKSLKKKEAMWFGSDVDQFGDSDFGILDPKIIDYKIIFDFDHQLKKCERLHSFQGEISHAMLLKGTNIINRGTKKESSDKWLVENSWGDSTGKNGNFTMSDEWFDDHVYMLAVHKKYVPSNILKEAKSHKTIILSPWSPFGALLRKI
jgi:bleomycin hydrolase